jgi:N6-L-threonylcarbamoyladenine synthase
VPEFPFVAMLASGGHTAIYQVDGPDTDSITELGATRDDAAGEAYDKVAKLLGLGYPGGPVIDQLAKRGNPEAVMLSTPMPARDSLEFSFSGLKTNVARWVEANGVPTTEPLLLDLCAAFQRRVVDALVQKSLRAARRHGLQTLVLGGGVAANSELRRRSVELAAEQGVRVVIPPFRSCTDNAAMIAYAGGLRLLRGENDAGRLTISTRTILPRVTRKGQGPRTSRAVSAKAT